MQAESQRGYVTTGQRSISRKARKDRQVKKSNFFGARGWVALACLAYLARKVSDSESFRFPGNLRRLRKLSTVAVQSSHGGSVQDDIFIRFPPPPQHLCGLARGKPEVPAFVSFLSRSEAF